MRTYIWRGVKYTITEDEYQGLLNGWLNPADLFG